MDTPSTLPVKVIAHRTHIAVSRPDQVLALGLEADETLRVADLGCGLLPLLEDFRSLAKACGVRSLEYCGIEKENGVAEDACEVRSVDFFFVVNMTQAKKQKGTRWGERGALDGMWTSVVSSCIVGHLLV